MEMELTRRGISLMGNKGEVVIYQTEDGLSKLEVNLQNETVWLTIDQMAELFQRDKSTISRHIKNVFSEGELERDSVVAFFATTASDGKTYNVEYFNLDVIISVGYRVKSQRGTQFRIWANSVLKELKIIEIVFNGEFNKSVVLDYEQRLIKYCSADKRFRNILNKNKGQQAWC